MTNQVVKRPVDVLKSVLNAPSVQEQFQNALGSHKDAFVASVIDLYNGNTSLQRCEPKTLVMEALKAATLALPINRALGFSYIIPFNNSVKQPDGSWEKVVTPTFVIGYKGYIQLAMRTGQYRIINADYVYEGELRSVNRLTGEIDFSGEKTSDKIAGYFCHIELINGFTKTLFMTVREMASYAKRYSPSVGYKTSIEQLEVIAQSDAVSKKVGWEGNFNDMALKTVIRRLLSKYGYLSVEMQSAMTMESEEAAQPDKPERIQLDMQDTQYEEVVQEEEKKESNEEDLPY